MRPPAQRRHAKFQRVARESPETTGEERFDLVTVGGSKNERVRPSSNRFLSAGEWENCLVVEWASASERLTG